MRTPSPIEIAATAFVYAGSIVAGYLASLLHVPLPWMIGPLVFTVIVSSYRRDAIVWHGTRPLGQMVVASVVGLSFTPQAVTAIAQHIALIILVSIGTILSGALASLVLRRLSQINPMSALIASIPGGPAEMSALALRNNVPAGPVIIVQTIRIALLVLVIPPVVVAFSDPIDPNALLGLSTTGHPGGWLLLEFIGMIGSLVFFFLRFNSPFFLGSLAFSATASALMLPVSMPPYWLLASAQILLGTWLGRIINEQARQSGPRFLASALVSTAVLILLSVALALGVSLTMGISWQTMTLATAPGSVTEMALTARLLHQDVAMVTAFQVIRIFIIMSLAPFAYTVMSRIAGKRSGKPD